MKVFIPFLDLGKATDADSKFTFSDGIITFSEINIYSVAFAMIGSGTYDYIMDNVNLKMRANMQGPLGIIFFPVSKLFEYEGTGTLKETKWEPVVF